jgi:hypothetical protein
VKPKLPSLTILSLIAGYLVTLHFFGSSVPRASIPKQSTASPSSGVETGRQIGEAEAEGISVADLLVRTSENGKSAKNNSANSDSGETSAVANSLEIAFTKAWIDGWLTGRCIHGWYSKGPCTDVGTLATKMLLTNQQNDDPWVSYAAESISSIARSAIPLGSYADYRVKCNSIGCVVVLASPSNPKLPSDGGLKKLTEFFSLEAEDVFQVACWGCLEIDTTILIVTRKKEP